MFGSPEESVTARKKEHLKNVAARYRETHEGLPIQWRIDFVAVELDREGTLAASRLLKTLLRVIKHNSVLDNPPIFT